MGDDYFRLICTVPIPSIEQTQRFCDFVAGAHSWYKHLPPFPPGAEFVFCLDPNAGRDITCSPTGEVAFTDRADGRKRFHYSWMKTDEYSERLGHWNYSSFSS